jgi:hypothetical protein
MRILALDLASTAGFAIGEAGEIPRSGSVRLKRPGDGPEVAAFNLRQFLREQIFTLDRPELVVVEAFIHPAGQKSGDAAILSIGLYFVAAAESKARDCRFEKAQPSTVRKHFIGVGRTGDRSTTKRAVVLRAQQIGYMPRDCGDNDRADACAVFDWASATFARKSRPFVMFGAAE